MGWVGYLEVGFTPLGSTFECESVEQCRMCRANVNSPALAAATEDDANHALLGCWDILGEDDRTYKSEMAELTRRALPSIHHRLLFVE